MKKHHWHVFQHEKLFKKQSQSHCQTRSTPQAFMFSWHN
jgi:hypothetical protein